MDDATRLLIEAVVTLALMALAFGYAKVRK
jgi:hypothetical protein